MAWCVEFTEGPRKAGILIATINDLLKGNLKSHLH